MARTRQLTSKARNTSKVSNVDQTEKELCFKFIDGLAGAPRIGHCGRGESVPLPTIIIAQRDRTIAQRLANDLQAHVARVAVTESATELHTILQRREARVAVLDLEIVDLEEVCRLASIHDDLTIVCTHRAPDERMWMAALRAGAAEFCHPRDVRSILRALRTASKHHTAIDSHPPSDERRS
jgi:DNA-binding NtrC family response regulator